MIDDQETWATFRTRHKTKTNKRVMIRIMVLIDNIPVIIVEVSFIG